LGAHPHDQEPLGLPVAAEGVAEVWWLVRGGVGVLAGDTAIPCCGRNSLAARERSMESGSSII
jgi:hypothetical protein